MFYPPASWLLGGVLGTISGWHAAPVLFVLLALLGAGASMYLLAREWAPPAAATFAACLYVANPYAMFVVYERSALGELLAGAWLPSDGFVCLENPVFRLRRWDCRWLPCGSPIRPRRSWAATCWQSSRWECGSRKADHGRLFAPWAEWLWGWDWQRSTSYPRHSNSDGYKSIAPSSPGCGSKTAFSSRTPRTLFMIKYCGRHPGSSSRNSPWPRSPPAWRGEGKPAAGRELCSPRCFPIILLLQLPVSDVIWKLTPHLKFLQFPWRWTLALSVLTCALAGWL